MNDINFADIVKSINNRRKHIRYNFQELAVMLATKLNDKKQIPMYMRLCKFEDKELLMKAFSHAVDAPGVKSKGPLFLWYLSKLKKETKYRLFIGLFPLKVPFDTHSFVANFQENAKLPNDCKIKITDKDKLHLTLLFFGNIDGVFYPKLAKVVYKLKTKYGDTVNLKSKSLIIKDRYIWLTDFNSEVYRYFYGAKKIIAEDKALKALSLPKKILPHITLARLNKCKGISLHKRDLDNSINFEAYFALVKTKLTKKGASYTIHRFD